MEYTQTTPDKSYFAAANGYGGFRSLFSEIFNPEIFERIYIIKGGPGTGKSSMLKRLICYAKERGYYCEAIYCSSDPRSLDGAIIKNRSRTIAILDGTAPHTYDASYPGATEEIIDLGTGFRTSELAAQRERIISLANRKKAAYKSAYDFLSLAGKIRQIALGELSKYINYCKAECLIDNIVKAGDATSKGVHYRVYTSSFSKDGYRAIEGSSDKKKERIGMTEGRFISELLMGLIYKRLLETDSVLRVSPSPLDDSIIEEIETSECIYSLSDGDVKIRAGSILTADPPNITPLTEMHEKVLGMAQMYFAEASSLHMELEDIYKSCVDFKNNDRICKSLEEKISALLEN